MNHFFAPKGLKRKIQSSERASGKARKRDVFKLVANLEIVRFPCRTMYNAVALHQ
jgi:hypothetical protein